jgi:hypothetical protein
VDDAMADSAELFPQLLAPEVSREPLERGGLIVDRDRHCVRLALAADAHPAARATNPLDRAVPEWYQSVGLGAAHVVYRELEARRARVQGQDVHVESVTG